MVIQLGISFTYIPSETINTVSFNSFSEGISLTYVPDSMLHQSLCNTSNYALSTESNIIELVNQYEYDIQLVSTFDPLIDRKPYELVNDKRRVTEYFRITKMR